MYRVDVETLNRTARRMVQFSSVASNEDDSFDARHPPRDPVLRDLVQATPNLTYSRVFRTVTDAELAELIGRAKDRDTTYEPPSFRSYYFADPLHCHPPGVHDEVLTSTQFHSVVGALHLQLGGQPPGPNMSNDPYWVDEWYFKEAPRGTDVQYGWSKTGGDGSGIRLGDVEVVLPLSHVDLPENKIKTFGMSGSVPAYQADHATAVLGIIMAKDDDKGMIGGVPELDKAIVVANVSGGAFATGDSIVKAAAKLRPGDVLLIEHECTLPVIGLANNQFGLGIPAEINKDAFDAIEAATAGGVIVIEAGGNGDGSGVPVDFDTLKVDAVSVFKPGTPNFRESRAIVVSAAYFDVGSQKNKREAYAPFGDRVDCYARGSNVATCRSSAVLAAAGLASTAVLGTFGGTSASAAIIAACAIQIQSLLKQNNKPLLTPLGMRDLFRSLENGTEPAAELPTARPIRFMPDMKKIIDHYFPVPVPPQP